MKRSWGWVLACLAVVGLLWSLGRQVTLHLPSSFEKPSVAGPRAGHSLVSGRNLQVLRRGMIRTRTGLQQFCFAPDVFFSVEDGSAVGPPWLDYRGPPGRQGDPGRTVGLASRDGRDGGPSKGVKLRFHPEFSEWLMIGIKNRGFCNSL